MRFKQYIKEFKGVPYEWIIKSSGEWKGEFVTSGGNKYVVFMERKKSLPGKTPPHLVGMWRVDYGMVDNNNNIVGKMTGTGDEFEVIGTVKTMFENWFATKKPEKIRFSGNANDRGRTAVYKRFAKMIEKKGFSCIPMSGINDETSDPENVHMCFKGKNAPSSFEDLLK